MKTRTETGSILKVFIGTLLALAVAAGIGLYGLRYMAWRVSLAMSAAERIEILEDGAENAPKLTGNESVQELERRIERLKEKTAKLEAQGKRLKVLREDTIDILKSKPWPLPLSGEEKKLLAMMEAEGKAEEKAEQEAEKAKRKEKEEEARIAAEQENDKARKEAETLSKYYSKSEEQQQAEELEQYQREPMLAYRRAKGLYPAIAAPGSPASKAYTRLNIQYRRENPDFFKAADWPIRLAKEAAGE